MSLSRAFQWVGVAAVLLVLVGLNYEFESKAGMQMNAAPESPLSQSLRGYWKLDDGSGTNATDASGNANTLAMTGSPSWTTGNIGPYSLDFSGTAQYLSVADPASGVLDFGDGADFTVSGWFNRDTFTADHTIVAKKTNQTTNAGYVVWVDASTDTVNFEISDGTDTYEADSATAFTATGWHHFVAVWNDSNGAFVYIDGGLNGSTTSSTSSIGDLSNANAFRIGAESDAGVPFDGKLDDIRIYGYALSADEVAKLYQTTAPAQPVDTSLVGHWTFDGPDIQGTTAIDRSGKGNNGTITGTTKTLGKLGQGLSFNGTSDYIQASSNIDITGNKTVSMWIKPTRVMGNNVIFYASDGTQNDFLVISLFDGIIGAMTDNIYDVTRNKTANVSLNTNQWYHVVIAKAAYSPTIYVDGTDVSLDDGDYVGGNEAYTAIGGDPNYTGYFFYGTLDDVRIYNRILSASEVLSLYNIGR